MSGLSKFKWERRKRKIVAMKKTIAIAVVAIAAILVCIYLLFPTSTEPFPIITGLSTLGYKEVSIDAGIVGSQGVVTLTSGCQRIVAYVEDYQAESIIRGMEGTFAARPNAHDIVADVFQSLGIELLMVKITDMRNNTYYGKMIVKSGNNFATLDARPSDATAIAVRMGVPIYVKEDLLKTYGENVC